MLARRRAARESVGAQVEALEIGETPRAVRPAAGEAAAPEVEVDEGRQRGERRERRHRVPPQVEARDGRQRPQERVGVAAEAAAREGDGVDGRERREAGRREPQIRAGRRHPRAGRQDGRGHLAAEPAEVERRSDVERPDGGRVDVRRQRERAVDADAARGEREDGERRLGTEVAVEVVAAQSHFANARRRTEERGRRAPRERRAREVEDARRAGKCGVAVVVEYEAAVAAEVDVRAFAEAERQDRVGERPREPVVLDAERRKDAARGERGHEAEAAVEGVVVEREPLEAPERR